MSRQRRALVTGAAGFLGSHLTDRLLRMGYSVLGVDNFLTGSERNLLEASGNPSFKFVEHDVTEPLKVDVDLHLIFNLACPASPDWYQRAPVDTLKTNVLGALNLLQLAERTGARIIQASTSEVYGDPLISPQSEDYWGNVNPVGPRSCYDEGKRAAETLFKDFGITRGVDARIARIFNTYGPRMAVSDGRVVSNFIVQSLLGQPITLYGDGSQTRSFCFVSDMIDGLVRLAAHEGRVNGPINLGNPTETTIVQLARNVMSHAQEVDLVFRPLPEDDPRRRKPDTRLAKEKLGWEARTTLDAGLVQTIGYFRSILGSQ